MKSIGLALLNLGVLVLCPTLSLAQIYPVGYFNSTFTSGYNLFCNPLNTASNYLSSLFYDPPDGTTISLWNSATRSFDLSSVYMAGAGWSLDLRLDPGRGALLYTPFAYTNTFVGVLLEPDGSLFTVDDIDAPLKRPPVFGGPTGVYLLACKTAVVLGPGGLPVFDFILGRGPREGEQFTWFDPSSQTYQTTTFKSGVWNNRDPFLRYGSSAFSHIYASPSLRIVTSGRAVILSWPASAPDFVLETSSILVSNAVWTPLTYDVVTNGDSFVLTNEPSAGQSFYRLRHQ